MLEQGDVVLIPIPFTDLTSVKRRPVVIVSNNKYNSRGRDIVVAAMTSNPRIDRWTFTIQSTDLERGILNHPGQIRADKIYTLSQSIIVKKFGKVKPIIVDKLRTLIIELIGQ